MTWKTIQMLTILIEVAQSCIFVYLKRVSIILNTFSADNQTNGPNFVDE